MIAASASVNVMIVTKPVDVRKGADGLPALAREQLRHDRTDENLQINSMDAGFKCQEWRHRRTSALWPSNMFHVVDNRLLVNFLSLTG